MSKMTENKRIIVEFGARRQQLTLTDARVSTSQLRGLIGYRFGVQLDSLSTYVLQMYDCTSNVYCNLSDEKRTFDVNLDFEPFHRFRIVKKALPSQASHLLNNLQSTVGRLQSTTQDVHQIQNLLGTLNRDCHTIEQLMNTHYPKSSSDPLSYLFDPSRIKKDGEAAKALADGHCDEENFDSVSCYAATPTSPIPLPHESSIPTTIHARSHPSSVRDDHIQTRIIPCKYAVRGICSSGDKCLYLHDEACIRSAREWERRL